MSTFRLESYSPSLTSQYDTAPGRPIPAPAQRAAPSRPKPGRKALPSSSLPHVVTMMSGRPAWFAPDAVRLLRAHGLSARPLEGGLPDWRLAGLPVATGASA